MKKKYTKKQITEAIAYWEKQLKLMNESSSDATYKCVAITQVIMAYMKHKINIDADYLLNQVYQMASTMTSMDEVYSIRDQILDESKNDMKKKYTNKETKIIVNAD